MTRHFTQTPSGAALPIDDGQPEITGYIVSTLDGLAYVAVDFPASWTGASVSLDVLDSFGGSRCSPSGIVCPDAMGGRFPHQEKPSAMPKEK